MQFVASEDELVRAHYILKTPAEIGQLLGRPAASVTSRAKQIMRRDEEFRRMVSQRVADKNVKRLKAAVNAGSIAASVKNKRNERLFGGPLQPVIRSDVTTMPVGEKPFNRECRPVAGRSSVEMTAMAVERVAKRKDAPRRRCSYFHFNESKGRSAQCAEFAAVGSAWCPECSVRIAILRKSA